MDIVVSGHHVAVSDRFREQIEDKLAKVPQLSPRARRVEVIVRHEPNKRQGKSRQRVEITCFAKGPVVRAEASQEDKLAALDLAVDKLMERLRRIGDKRQVRRGRRAPESVATATARSQPVDHPAVDTAAPGEDGSEVSSGVDVESTARPFDGSPIEVREKVHTSAPMTLADAINEMELVGHDFFLFHDSETDKASVAYRRRGWSYGVLHLDLAPAGSAESDGG